MCATKLEFPRPEEKILPHNIAIVWPPTETNDSDALDRITGSLVGLAVGDALGASVEFRPHEYLVANPVREMMAGGTWGLRAGQWTDDTSMALCLASSLITQKGLILITKWFVIIGGINSVIYLLLDNVLILVMQLVIHLKNFIAVRRY